MPPLNLNVKYRIVKLPKLSGNRASVYTVFLEDEGRTLFERFISENKGDHTEEIEDIIGRIRTMSNKLGAREQFFKLKEGAPGDLVCALYDVPEKKLRLYCIRYGSCCIVLGGGGTKPKDVRAWQEDDKLASENKLIQTVSNDIFERIQDGEIEWSADGMDLIGNLKFNYEDE